VKKPDNHFLHAALCAVCQKIKEQRDAARRFIRELRVVACPQCHSPDPNQHYFVKIYPADKSPVFTSANSERCMHGWHEKRRALLKQFYSTATTLSD
jgi:hypothetical protein